MNLKLSMQNQTLTTKKPNVQSLPFWFSGCFNGYMDMYEDIEVVAQYLDAHEGWFCRCAQPMKVNPLGNNGYVINIGRFASLGFEVEPKIAVVLDPPQDGLYVMRTIPVPNYESLGYDVQYKGLMELKEVAAAEIAKPSLEKIFGKNLTAPCVITRVSWQLDLAVTVEFPRFIEKLPTNLVQTTGDRLLSQIVRQVSPRLTYKVQQDFHSSRKLPLPHKNGRGFSKMMKESDFLASTANKDSKNRDYAA